MSVEVRKPEKVHERREETRPQWRVTCSKGDGEGWQRGGGERVGSRLTILKNACKSLREIH